MSNAYEKIRNEVVAGGAVEEADETVSGARAAVGIGIIVGLLALLAFTNIWTFTFLIGLLISIFLHEVGHFSTARWSDIKVTQFFMGMGPRLWSFKRGEVEYGLRALPVGAFVRMIGMNNLDETAPEDEPRAFRNKSYPRRLLTITAGSLMHMAIAIVLLFSVYTGWGDPVGDGRVTFTEVTGPAASAGIEADDRVVAIDGVKVDAIAKVRDLIRRHEGGETVVIDLIRDGQSRQISVVLDVFEDGENVGKARLGVASSEGTVYQDVGFASSLRRSVTDLGSTAWDSVGGVITVMNPVNIVRHLSGSDTDQTTQPVTVVGVTQFSGTIGKQAGLPGVLTLLAGINVFVGLINMFPLLPFDGGHAAIATYERIRSRKKKAYHADVAKMIPLTMAVMGFLIFVAMSGLYLDITNPIK
jgi:membrane-associated protease RseP (regulator of RpoE activity)